VSNRNSRYASTQQRRDAWEGQNGLCAWCGKPLGHDHDADHVQPWTRGGITGAGNLQLLHKPCHVEKSRIYDPLRDWQANFLDRFSLGSEQTFLLQAGVGSGKTRAGIAAFDRWRIGKRHPLLVVLAPSVQIMRGWAEHAVTRGPTGVVNLDPREREIETGGRRHTLLSITSGPAEDDIALLLTYQSLSGMAGVLNRVCRSRDVFVIADEVHHVESSEEAVWGAAAEAAFACAERMLALSATPFRSNGTPISFLTYEDGIAVPDFEFSVSDSIASGYTVPVSFSHYDGRAEWRRISLDEDDDIAFAPGETGRISEPQTSDQALSVAVEDIDFCMELVAGGKRRLAYIRETSHPHAKGLVVAKDQAMARRIGRVMNEAEPGVAVVAVSDSPDAHRTIAEFKSGRTSARWLVAVGMVSEGCDIPDLKVLVYLTCVRTRIAFVQLVGRVVRAVGDDREASVILPDHPTLSGMARDFLRLQPIRLSEQVEDEEGVSSQEAAVASIRVGVGVQDVVASAVTHDAERLAIGERVRQASAATGIPIDLATRLAKELLRDDHPAPSAVAAAELPSMELHDLKATLRDEAVRLARRIIVRSGKDGSRVWTEAYERAGLPNRRLEERTIAELRCLVSALRQMAGE
jgi:superfamily II DNA or RNA helicase